ncbi:sushi, von Willebrand factor type A, EGF and pentraxin domain-containing protein 1-like isoform X1 [Zeugodacus cucurbitae]|uniref:sushi, von Willebrand factor type A, EGF and pentraxin domain-containing protein 1-like isoform X1 n=2 Tax=Zeugodacus cucurbitae TaxID=28588 RepID=UPI0023D90F3A|nr:sushi, von Willebrand factor type A, EGF and pentraxin domain-containing protein 1-like isoform X1 [Zeugodacus cucurbitae]
MIKESSYFEFTCEDGYKLDGENRSTCMNNGWSSAAPTCIPLCDLSLVSPCTAPLLCRHNHKTSFFNFGNRADVVLPGVHVDYSCEDGYELDGAMFITCTNNGWSNRIPTCKETVCDVSIFADCTYPLKCKIYDRTLRKYKSIYRRDIPELSNNENLYVNCEDGYTLQGSQYLACRGRKWDGIMPKCFEKISKTCEQEILDNCIYPMICERFESEFSDFIKVKFSCENGYMLDGGNSLTYTDGKWDHNLPKCIVAHSCSGHLIPICEHPLICTLFDAKSKSKQKIINNNIIQSTNYTLDTQIIFSCGYGYKLKGAEQTTCGSNGWSHEQSLKLPQCSELISQLFNLVILSQQMLLKRVL